VNVGGTFSSTAIEIIKWVKKFAVAQVSTQTQERVDNGTGERGCAATEVSTGREEERLVGSTVLFNAWLILCHEAVQINQPNRPHQIPIHSIYVLTPTPATRTSEGGNILRPGITIKNSLSLLIVSKDSIEGYMRIFFCS
jgi:hypothetical protein